MDKSSVFWCSAFWVAIAAFFVLLAKKDVAPPAPPRIVVQVPACASCTILAGILTPPPCPEPWIDPDLGGAF